MDVIDIAVTKVAAEALVLELAQGVIVPQLPDSLYEKNDPLAAAPFGSEPFQSILTDRPPGTDPNYVPVVPFYVTAVNVLNAEIAPRARIIDNLMTPLDDVDSPAVARIRLLVPNTEPRRATLRDFTSGAAAGPARFDVVSLSPGAISQLREVMLELSVEITVQNEEGYPNRPVLRATEVLRLWIVFDFVSTFPGQVFASTATAAAPYTLKLVPKVLNILPSAGTNLTTLLAIAGVNGLGPEPAMPRQGELTPSGWLALGQQIRSAFDNLNQTLANKASIDLNDFITSLAGDDTFVPNAGLILTGTQVRLRVQVARQSGWFQPSFPEIEGVDLQFLRNAMRANVVDPWVRFLTLDGDMTLPTGTSFGVDVGPWLLRDRIYDALYDLFDQDGPGSPSPIPGLIANLRRSLDRDGVPRTLVPLSSISLINNAISTGLSTEEVEGEVWTTWEGELRFIDACPASETDIDVSFRLGLHVTGTVPLGTSPALVGSTPRSDLVLRARLGYDLDNGDLAACLTLLGLSIATVATFALSTLTAVSSGLVTPAPVLFFSSLAITLLPEGVALVRREMEDAIRHGIMDALIDLVGSAGTFEVFLRDVGVILNVDAGEGVVDISVRLPGAFAVVGGMLRDAITPRGFDADGSSWPDLTFQDTSLGGNLLAGRMPGRALVLALLDRQRTAQAEYVNTWQRAHTFGRDASGKFAWVLDGCRVGDEDGRPVVTEARYTFNILNLPSSPVPMKVFDVSILLPVGLMRNLTMRLAREGVRNVMPPSTMTPMVLAPGQTLWVTLSATRSFVAERIRMNVQERLLVVVATDRGRYVLTMDQPFENLRPLLDVILDPARNAEAANSLTEMCLLGRGVPGTTQRAREGRGGPLWPQPDYGGDIASLLMRGFGGGTLFDGLGLREGLGVNPPREIVNPDARLGELSFVPEEARTGFAGDQLQFGGTRDLGQALLPGDMRDIAQLAMRAGRN